MALWFCQRAGEQKQLQPSEVAWRQLLREALWYASLAIVEGHEGGIEVGADVDNRAVVLDRCLGISLS